MKHIKLFENWAEENVELPWYLDPSKKYEVLVLNGTKTYNIWSDEVQEKIQNTNCDFTVGYFHVNFKSFSDYTFWLPEYTELVVGQTYCKYKLEDCFGIPETDKLRLYSTNIKSLKGLEKRKLHEFVVNYSKIENLKYCPQSSKFDFYGNPLLSFYGITSNNIQWFNRTLCGELTYEKAGYGDLSTPTLEQLNDPKFNASIFCIFPFKVTKAKYPNDIYFNPWNQIYEDPNEVENYSFLFLSFYFSSENFRTKAKEYLPYADLTSIIPSETEVW